MYGMKMTGKAFDLMLGSKKCWEYEVTDAVVEADSVSIDWDEGDGTCHLNARSTDHGLTWEAIWGDPGIKLGWTMTLTQYVARSGEIVLWGDWIGESGSIGKMMFQLSPTP